MQMPVALDGGCVVTVFPERAQATLATVVLLRGAPSGKLNAAGDNAVAGILYQQMNVVGRDDVVEHTEPKTLARFIEPAQVAGSVLGKLQQKSALVAAMRDVPDQAGQEMAICTRHRFSPLERCFWPGKGGSKRL